MPTEAEEIRYLDSLTDDQLRARYPGLTQAGISLIRMGMWVPPFGPGISDEDVASMTP